MLSGKDETGQSIDIKKYRSMIESLLYLSASRPDIMFSVCMCARYQANPKESHLSACHTLISSGDHLFGGMQPSLDRFEVLNTHR